MSNRIELDLGPLNEAVQAILGLDFEEIGHEAVTDSSAVLLNRIRTNFLATRDPLGRQWEPSYAAFRRSFGIGANGQKLKRGAGGKTLFDTGNLFHSIQLYSVSPLEMGIATDVEYGIYLQEGTKYMPAREFLGFGEEDFDIAYGVLLSKIDEALTL
jgi:phage gpG-like protein